MYRSNCFSFNRNPLLKKIEELEARVHEAFANGAEQDINEAIKAYVDCRYNEQICPNDPMPNDLSSKDYRLLWEELNAVDWQDVPNSDAADNEWVKNQLHSSMVNLYHQEEYRAGDL